MIECFDVVRLPFPFSDKDFHKTRPALVISSADAFNQPAGHAVVAMITSSANSHFPLDVRLQEFRQAGLLKPSIVRMKLYTCDCT